MRLRANEAGRRWINATLSTLLFLALAFGLAACAREDDSAAPQSVVIYCSVDQEYAEAILEQFQQAHPEIKVEARYDTEATKTTGLVERLRSERDNPRADLFWSSEVFLTVKLAEEELLRPFPPLSTLKGWPEVYRGDENHWFGFAGRARVIAFDPSRVDDPPMDWLDLAEPQYHGRVVMADPNFGTTRGHVATWFAWWGESRAEAFLHALRENDLRLVQSNSQTVRDVVNGLADFGVTDTDDVWAARRNGHNLQLVYPRHGAEPGMGTLLIPNTLSLIAGRPERPETLALAEFLLSPELERLLYESDSHNVPIRYVEIEMAAEHHVPDPLVVDYEVVTEQMDHAIATANRVLISDSDG